MAGDWRSRAGTRFETEKRAVVAARGMVVSNHPLGSAAGAEMLAAGGNAIDAAIAALFCLTVVEPMMVGIFGAGIAHLRLADGRHLVLDGYSVAPAAARPDMYRPISQEWPDYLRTEGEQNMRGVLAVGVPGTLYAWCQALARFGTLDLETVLAPAIRWAERGFRATAYLVTAIEETAADLARFPDTARTWLPGGKALRAGDRVVQSEYAATLRVVAKHGADALYSGELGARVVEHLRREGGLLTREDLARYRTVERRPLLGDYRGFTVAGPPPPTAGGLHVIEMLNVLEGYDLAALGYGTAEYFHLLAETLKLAFADRNASTGDPDFVAIPVERLTSKGYAAERRREIDLARARQWSAGVTAAGSAHTPHVTAADALGNVISTTQTINDLFGAKVTVPGTGMLLNNTMALFDPHPGHAMSVAPGKRMTSSMAPTLVLRDGRPVLALGLPGGVRIFPSVLQALLNVIDHGMALQEAVEAPRVWTQGQELEVETGVPENVRAALAGRGHRILPVPTVGLGMNAIAIDAEGTLTGAACWRADGTPMGIGGGYARPGTRFYPPGR